ncbi:hypothetical protein [Solicola gregarius]|uniref:Uncharacterized protein n=1 Tax=Solicola gregarius TaxID=2908642 RepID=A0AA46TE14_9ACTN|nr:hypothetical protein [Solicola gregarius]UYM03607.1 hypothetical protein L0C25_13710 [Solicola gregarius]
MTFTDTNPTAATTADTGDSPTVAERPRPVVTRPVFVDATGRRAHRARRWGIALVTPAAAYLVAVAISLMGGSSLNSAILPIPGLGSSARSAGASQSPAGTDETNAAVTSRTGGTDSDRSQSSRPDLVEPDSAGSQESNSGDTQEIDNTSSQGDNSVDAHDDQSESSDNKPDPSNSSNTGDNSSLPDQAATQAQGNSNRPPLPTQADSNASVQQPHPSTSNASEAGQDHAQSDHATEHKPGPDAPAAATR